MLQQLIKKSIVSRITWTELRNGNVGDRFYVPRYGIGDRIYEETAKIVYKDTEGCAILITKSGSRKENKKSELQWFQFLNGNYNE